MNIDLDDFNPRSFDSGPVAVADTVNWVSIATLQLGGRRRSMLIDITVGSGGGLNGFKITRAATPGGPHRDYFTGTDFNTATAEMLDCITSAGGTPNIHTLLAGESAQVHIDQLESVQEIGVWAKAASTATTVQAIGTASGI